MSTPQQRIQAEVQQALKSGDKERVSTLRMLLNALENERIRLGGELDEQMFLGQVRKAIKQRQEASEQFRRGGRDELAAREEREAELLQSYLPPPVDEEELRAAIREFVASRQLAGAQDLGAVMQEMLGRFAGRADGATINRLARQVLSDSS